MAAQSPRAPAVVVDRVWKQFRMPQEQVHTLKERALHPFRRSRFDRFDALQDVSFQVEPGEFFGIVGRNGSGKSTLLKCLAGIYGVDRGDIYVDGRMSTFIELGVGFNPDLAAHDNALLNAVMMGVPRADAEKRIDDIIAFAELEEFVDLKLKNYSSGMLVRLAFATMLQVDADIMMIDEVLAVGDARFQQKCFDEFTRMRQEGRTILLVTHDMGAVERYCHRAMLLQKGELVTIGEPHEVARRYVELNFGDGAAEADADAVGTREGDPHRSGDGRASIEEAWLEGPDGERTEHARHGDRVTIRFRAVMAGPLDEPIFGVELYDDRGIAVFAANTYWDEHPTGHFEAGDEAVFTVNFENLLLPGRYAVTVAMAYDGPGAAIIDKREQLCHMLVSGTQAWGPVVDLPHEVGLETVQATRTAEPTT